MLKRITVWGAAARSDRGGAARDTHGARWRARCRRSVGASTAAAADRAAGDLGRAAGANPLAARAGRRAEHGWSRPPSRLTSRSLPRLPTARAASCSIAATASSSACERWPGRSDGVLAADSRRRLLHAAADRSRFWRALRGRRFGFLEPRRRRDFRDPRSVVRRLHVESRRGEIRRGAPPRRDVPRARQRAVVGARGLAAAAHVDDRARRSAARSSRTAILRVAGARTTYRSFAGTQELVVAIDRMPCNDTMSGELFDNTVAVTLRKHDVVRLRLGRPVSLYTSDQRWSAAAARQSAMLGNACHFCADLLAATTVSMNAMPRSAALMPGTARGAGSPLAPAPCARTCAAKLR